MLMEMLGVLIGFVTVILMLSLVVTAVVQMMQSILRLRGGALRDALKDLVHTLDEDNSLQKANAGPKEALIIAMRASAHKNTKPGLLTALLDNALGPRVSNMTATDILPAFTNGTVEPEVRIGVDRMLPRMEARSKEIFRLRVRVLTVVVSVAVAGFFQVNAPTLLARLSEDDALRDRLVSEAEARVEGAEAGADSVVSLGSTDADVLTDVAHSALSELTDAVANTDAFPESEYPGVVQRIEVASGNMTNRVALLDELREVLSDPRDDLEPLSEEAITKVLRTYETLLQNASKSQTEVALSDVRTALSTTSRFRDIMGWKGKEYFTQVDGEERWNWNNILGVLMTAGLLSFGSQFWFERLRDLINLRDALDPGRPRGGATPSGTETATSGAPVVDEDHDDVELPAPLESSDSLDAFLEDEVMQSIVQQLDVDFPVSVDSVDDAGNEVVDVVVHLEAGGNLNAEQLSLLKTQITEIVNDEFRQAGRRPRRLVRILEQS